MSSNANTQDDIGWRRDRTKMFKRKSAAPGTLDNAGAGTGDRNYDATNGSNGYDQEKGVRPGREGHLPTHNEEGHRINHNGHRVTKGIEPDGESGRKYIHPLKFVRICFRSSCTASKWTNILWPFTIAALVMYGQFRDHHVAIFALAYIGMIPAANMVGFAGQEFARKIPKVAGVLLETTFGSVVEIILFMVLLVRGRDNPTANGENSNLEVIRAAILGSILANLLLCLGLCFFVGGIFHPQQTFHEAISEVGSNLMLVAGFALVVPTIYYQSLSATEGAEVVLANAVRLSRACAIVLLIAFCFYIFFQARSHHGLYEDILEADEQRDHDRHKDLAKDKLTLTESLIALAIALTFVTFMAIILVFQIEPLVNDHGVPDAFMGLILIPLVEKAAEHITAVDEAYDNQMNFALAHVLGASIQTALLNTPLVILVAWGLGQDLALNFEQFDAIVVILAIIVVGNFLRDEKSDYLEGALCVMVYALIAVSAFYYPNPNKNNETGSVSGGTEGGGAEAAARMLMKF